jgi:serine protease Do
MNNQNNLIQDRKSQANKTSGMVRWGAILTLVLLVVVLVALDMRSVVNQGGGGRYAATAEAADPSLGELSRGFATVAKQVAKAVVNINTEQIARETAMQIPEQFRDFFGGEPFGRENPRDRKVRSLGSGFIVDPNGFILTNNHVVGRAIRIRVKLDDGRTLDAKVIGTDATTDLAVVKIEATTLPVLVLGSSNKSEVGDWVLAFGSPFGLEKTMTAGIVSAKGRVIGAGPYDDFLQTDAAINPGNSGGPLVNLRGEVVGVNTIIASQSGGFEGVGFAIPSELAQAVYGQLIKTGKVTRGWLGVQAQEITPELAKSFSLPQQKGVLIADVQPGSPAASAGVKSGDVLLEYNGQAINNSKDLSFAVAATKVGVPTKLKVFRQGQELTIDVKVGERPDPTSEEERASSATSEGQGKLGIRVENLTPESARMLGVESAEGVVVTDVRSGSPADEGGLRSGDIIREINRTTVNKASDLQAVSRNLKAGSTVLLKIVRRGVVQFLAFDLP